MKLSIPVLIALVLVLGLATAYAWDEEATRLAYSLKWDQGVVVILNTRDSKYGTGWFIHPQFIVTAAHVVSYDINNIVRIVKGDFETNAHVVALDREKDIAILMLDEPYPKAHIFPLRPNIEKGETIYVIGFPYELAMLQGYDWRKISMNPRAAKGTATWTGRQWLIELGTYVDAGNSGGPVVDESGAVVGLVTFALRGEAATMYFATSAKEVVKLCQKYGVPFTIAGKKMSFDIGAESVVKPLNQSFALIMLGAFVAAIIAIVGGVLVHRR